MVYLDTTFFVDLVRAKPEAGKKLLHFLENDERITTTPVNAAELYDGAYSTKSRRTEAERVGGLLEHLELPRSLPGRLRKIRQTRQRPQSQGLAN